MAKKAWGGVFSADTDSRVEQFSESVSFDQRLAQVDLRGSTAHAQMLSEVGLISTEEATAIGEALAEIGEEIERGEFEFRADREDIHMHVEHALIGRLGDVGRKLHTARSRNDQVSTDLRLWVREAIDRLDGLLADVQRAFLVRAEADIDCILPAYTHLRRAQPVLASHYWLAYCEKLQRDRERLVDARKRVNVLPLGGAAAAGTTLPIDRESVRAKLGFDAIAANSLDVSSDRDFVLETAFALTLTSLHLSTWAEEWILWSTTEFGVLRLPQSFCTGSSIMPQKVNPDVLELIRGKTARVAGALQTLVVLVKGLPLAYNRDLQEDKPPLFDAVDTVQACLELAAPLIEGASIDREAVAARLEEGYLDATTLMEYLIRRGIPQRSAHGVVGELVRRAMELGRPLAELPLEEFTAAHESLDQDVYQVLGAKNSVQAFVSHGSTAPDQVRSQIEHWRARLAAS